MSRRVKKDEDYSVASSQRLLARARKVEALIDAKPTLFFTGIERIGGYPLFVERASGPYVWDVDGNRYIDFILGYGSVVLGHAHPAVSQAVQRDMQKLGANPSLLTVRQIELAERVVSLSPGTDSVTFLKTGSDATDAAIRLARAVTGRPYVLRWGMNGWHDWCAPVPMGVLETARQYTIPFRYNDLDQLKSLFSAYGEKIACVILMPYEIDAPLPGFLEGVRNLCHSYGALFILDEIRSGFRISMGGAQTYFGVEADLVTYGKALTNGFALSVLAGSKKYMKHILSLGLTVTYYRMPDAMAAGVATIDQLIQCNGPQRLEMLGRSLMQGLDDAAISEGVLAEATGLPWTPFIKFNYRLDSLCDIALRLFCNGMLRRGILLSPVHHWFVCTSMRSEDIDYTVDAARDVFAEIRRVI